MDRKAYVHKRKRKYMAQVLEKFERWIEPHLPRDRDTINLIRDFKGLVRARINALAVDACDVMDEDTEINEAGQRLRDDLDPVGRP